MATVIKRVVTPIRELATFVRAINVKCKIELDIDTLDKKVDWFYLSKTKKMGAYFIQEKPDDKTVFIIGIDKNPSSVNNPIIYYVKRIDRWGSVATVYDPAKVRLSEITLLELYTLYGFLIGNLSPTHKVLRIKRDE
jgi:hypothetical protein